jgi:hypothetical protein
MAISRVNVELKANVSVISSFSVIRVDVNDHMSLMFIQVCQPMPLPMNTAHGPRRF